MLIREFTESPDKKFEGVDLVDDLQHFMFHDPKFYRREMYPLIARIRDHIQSGERCKDSVFRETVDKAADVYCKKFNIPSSAKTAFTDEERDVLAQKIFHQERENIEKGHYDGAEQ